MDVKHLAQYSDPQFIADGFSFFTNENAKEAESELKKVEYIEARMDYSKPEHVLAIYEKAIREKVFKTPVGIYYLRDIQRYLKQQPGIDQERVVPIPLFFGYENRMRETHSPARNRVQTSKKKEEKSAALPMSVFLNVVLIIAMLAMFVITLNSNQPNILNYERAIRDKYASWEQDLIRREQVVREKEREYHIEME